MTSRSATLDPAKVRRHLIGRTSRRSSAWLRRGFGLMFVSGAVINVTLVTVNPDVYRTFADAAHWPLITNAWRSIVVPHTTLFVVLLAGIELTVGAVILAGGRRCRLGVAAAIAFHLALPLFGWGLMAGRPGLVVAADARRRGPVPPAGGVVDPAGVRRRGDRPGAACADRRLSCRARAGGLTRVQQAADPRCLRRPSRAATSAAHQVGAEGPPIRGPQVPAAPVLRPYAGQPATATLGPVNK